MFTIQNTVRLVSIFIVLSSNVRMDVSADGSLDSAVKVGTETFEAFRAMFNDCIMSPLPKEQFKIDNMKSFINYPARTTVGTSLKLTSNRKFFANVITTKEFKEMLNKDLDTIRANYVKKMKYCDNIVMNQDTLKDFYDREVDQTKMK